jgi:HEAT repeat protein
MRVCVIPVGLLCLLACGCGKKSTDKLIEDLKSPQERDRLIAVRLLPQRKGEASKIVPAMIEALQDKESDVRLSAAIGLGSFGEEAREAIPALQKLLNSRDARIREAAQRSLSRIDPANFSPPSKGKTAPAP